MSNVIALSGKDKHRSPHVKRDPAGKTALMRFVLSAGGVQLKPYSRLTTAWLVRPDFLALMFPDGTIEVIGERLDLLLDDLQFEHIRSIEAYDAAVHAVPDEGAPIVRGVRFVVDDLPAT